MISNIFKNTCPCCETATTIKWQEYKNKKHFYILYCSKCNKQVSSLIKESLYQIINIFSILISLGISFLLCWLFNLHNSLSIVFFIFIVTPLILVLPKFFTLNCYKKTEIIDKELNGGAEENIMNNLKIYHAIVFGLIPLIMVIVTFILLILDQ